MGVKYPGLVKEKFQKGLRILKRSMGTRGIFWNTIVSLFDKIVLREKDNPGIELTYPTGSEKPFYNQKEYKNAASMVMDPPNKVQKRTWQVKDLENLTKQMPKKKRIFLKLCVSIMEYESLTTLTLPWLAYTVSSNIPSKNLDKADMEKENGKVGLTALLQSEE